MTPKSLGDFLSRARLLLGLIALATLLTAAGPLGAAQPPQPGIEESRERTIERIEAYLNDLRSLRASFVQIAPDGGTSTGTLYYARPDKMRLDYDPPSELLIVANGWRLVYHDRRLEQVSQMFTRSTPLAFLLKDVVRLEGDVTVSGFERRGGEIGVALVQTEDPGQGQITLIFGEDPLELRRWTVTDAQGLTTHVVLEELEADVALDRSLFVWQNPDFYPELRRERR